jgi:osmotically-inducible protein OsmY
MKSDSEMQSDVQTALKWKPSVNTAQIGVTANNGVITLSGHVAHNAEKIEAEDTAKGFYGVEGVANEITVELPGASCQTDANVAAAAVSALKWDYVVPQDIVKVTVRDSWVTLDGTVNWQYEKEAADRCVRYLIGVSGVTNAIIIKSQSTAAGVKIKIEGAFRRSADLNARRITVEMTGDVVTLTGTVPSWMERAEASSAAWEAPGVTSVDDQLIISP